MRVVATPDTPLSPSDDSAHFSDNEDTDTIQSGYYEAIHDHLSRPAFISKPHEKSNIYLYDTSSSCPLEFKRQFFTNSEEFQSYISATPSPRTRIVSISSPTGIRPLGVTEPAMRKLMNLYNIDAGFLDLVVSFGSKPQSSGAGHGGMTTRQTKDGSYEMQYLFAHAEDPKSWTIRQTGVFHRFDPSGSTNLWIFLHANPSSSLHQHIESITARRGDALQSWFSLHSLALSAYAGNWRWYIQHLGSEIEDTANIALTMNISNYSLNQDGLLGLLKPHYLGDKLLPLSSRLSVMLETINQLGEMNALLHSKGLSTGDNFQQVANKIDYHRNYLQGCLGSANVLEQKVRGIAELVGVALNLKNQAVTIEINNQVLKLTRDSFDDNATVKMVTLVTLIYLPASFVATILGMNLFTYGPNDSGFSISRQFWIFVVIALPLTVVTLASWYFLTLRREYKAKEASQGAVEKKTEHS